MSFLPNDYKIPAGPSNYMKFEPGANKFRIVGDAITGYEYWTEKDDKKSPVRVKKLSDVPVARRFGEDRAKHFWAFPVYNYSSEQVQVLSINQVTIQTVIEAYTSNPDWGNPKEYDITVTKKGEGWDTEYIVTPSPKKPISEEIASLVSGTPIRMEALFTNEDPFEIAIEPTEIDPDDLDVDKLVPLNGKKKRK